MVHLCFPSYFLFFRLTGRYEDCAPFFLSCFFFFFRDDACILTDFSSFPSNWPKYLVIRGYLRMGGDTLPLFPYLLFLFLYSVARSAGRETRQSPSFFLLVFSSGPGAANMDGKTRWRTCGSFPPGSFLYSISPCPSLCARLVRFGSAQSFLYSPEIPETGRAVRRNSVVCEHFFPSHPFFQFFMGSDWMETILPHISPSLWYIDSMSSLSGRVLCVG